MMEIISWFFKSTPLAFMNASLWRDEAFSYLMSQLPVFELLSKTAQDSNPPLYYLLLKLWILVWGNSELSMRTLSLIFFWCMIYTVYLILHSVFKHSERKSFIYVLFCIVNPILHYYAFEVRMYSMVGFIAIGFVYAILSHNKKLSTIFLVTGALTHYFFVLIPVVYIALLWFVKKYGEIHSLFLHWKKTLYILVPWFIFVLISKPPFADSFWIAPPTLNHFISLPAIIMTGYESSSYVPFPALPYMSIILWFTIGFLLWHKRKNITIKELFLFIGAIGIPLFVLIVSLIKPIYSPRYLIFSSGMFMLFLSISIMTLPKKLQYTFFLLIVILNISYANVQINKRTKAPLRTTYSQIKNELMKGDEIYVVHEYDFHPALYYFDKEATVKIYKKSYDALPWYVGKVLIPKESVTDALPMYPKRAFVTSSNGSYSIQSRQ